MFGGPLSSPAAGQLQGIYLSAALTREVFIRKSQSWLVADRVRTRASLTAISLKNKRAEGRIKTSEMISTQRSVVEM